MFAPRRIITAESLILSAVAAQAQGPLSAGTNPSCIGLGAGLVALVVLARRRRA